jgi:hypothetical protein
MKFVSTRGDGGRRYSFEEAIMAGWAFDGARACCLR